MQKKFIIPIIVAVSSILFLVLYQDKIISKVNVAEDFWSERKITNPPIYEQNITKFVHVRDLADINQKRKQLINYVWEKDTMDNNLPDQIIPNFIDSRFSDLENLDRKIGRAHV